MTQESTAQEFQIWVYQRLELLCEEIEELRDTLDRIENKVCPYEMDAALEYYAE